MAIKKKTQLHPAARVARGLAQSCYQALMRAREEPIDDDDIQNIKGVVDDCLLALGQVLVKSGSDGVYYVEDAMRAVEEEREPNSLEYFEDEESDG